MGRNARASVPRTAALIALGAFALHQLRYLLAYGGQTGFELGRQGHGYLADALPILAAFALAALAAALVGAASRRAPEPAYPAPLRRRAVLLAAAMLAVFCCQESLEGALAAGHASGLAAVFAHGGWIAFPLALALGAVAALLDRGIARVERLVFVALRARRRPRPAACQGRPRATAVGALSATPLAFGLARRPPPAAAA